MLAQRDRTIAAGLLQTTTWAPTSSGPTGQACLLQLQLNSLQGTPTEKEERRPTAFSQSMCWIVIISRRCGMTLSRWGTSPSSTCALPAQCQSTIYALETWIWSGTRSTFSTMSVCTPIPSSHSARSFEPSMEKDPPPSAKLRLKWATVFSNASLRHLSISASLPFKNTTCLKGNGSSNTGHPTPKLEKEISMPLRHTTTHYGMQPSRLACLVSTNVPQPNAMLRLYATPSTLASPLARHPQRPSVLAWLLMTVLSRVVDPPPPASLSSPTAAMTQLDVAALSPPPTGASCCPTSAPLPQMKEVWITSSKLHMW